MQPIKYPGICGGSAASGILLVGLAYCYALFAAPSCSGQETKAEVPKEKQTTLGLYVTAAQAYEKWKAAPDSVKVIDVRTPEEYAFIGHPEMAWNVPVAFVTYQRKDGKTEYGARPNPDFVAEVKKLVRTSRHSIAHVPLRRSLRDGRQPARGRWFQERLQHHRRDGRGQSRRSRQRLFWEADEERLEEFGSLDLRHRPRKDHP